MIFFNIIYANSSAGAPPPPQLLLVFLLLLLLLLLLFLRHHQHYENTIILYVLAPHISIYTVSVNISDEFSSKSIILGCLATVADDTEAPPSKGRRVDLLFPAAVAAVAPPVPPPPEATAHPPADDALVPLLLDPCWRDSSSERRSLPGQAQIRTSTDWRPRTLELCSRVKIS